MKIGQYNLERPVFMAPMAGVTDKAFRETACSVGGQYLWSEMISSKALVYKNSRTLQMLNLEGESSPRIVQLFGSEAETMALAAELVVERGADIIDINMGCPTPKIVQNGEGAALLRDLPLAEKIAAAVVKAVKIPVSVKIRLGWNQTELVAGDIAKRLEASGVQMLSVHARTREQYYAGQADWNWIGLVKDTVGIPVIGNGDILTPQDAGRMIEQTGCDGVMIGRGALGNPWLIARAQAFLRGQEVKPEPDMQERLTVALAHFERLLKYKGDRVGLNEMRKHAVWYIKGIKHAARLRDQIMQTETPEEMKKIFCQIMTTLA